VFDIGFSEMVLIGLIALIVLGPKRLPEVARSAGQWAGKLRRFVENVKRDIDAEIKDEDLAAFKQMHAELNETRNMLQRSAADTFSNLSSPLKEASSSINETVSAAEPAATIDERLPPPVDPAAAIPPVKPARKSVSKKSSALTKTAAKPVARKTAGKKTVTKTNRTPHGGVKKTRV
jgi:sec-independent protein translocase protein TatB